MKTNGMKDIFNGLSKADRIKLKGTALVSVLTGTALEDIKAHPIRYPFYAVYLTCVLTPLPFPGFSTILALATVVWASTEMTPLAKTVNSNLKKAFNDETLIEKYIDHIAADKAKSNCYKVKNKSLAVAGTKKSLSDVQKATNIAYVSFRKFVSW